MIVELREGESQEHLLMRFRQAVQRHGVLRDAKKKRYFVSRSAIRRAARAKAIRRERKRASKRADRRAA